MVEINGYDIQLTRGHSLFLRIDLSGRDLPEGTDAVFTVKRSVRSDEVLLRKRFDASDEVVGIRLTSRETRLDSGVYVWDVRLQIPQEDGTMEVYTPMEYAAFVVLESVGEPVEDGDTEVTVDVQLAIRHALDAAARAETAARSADAAALAAKPYTVPSYWEYAVKAAVSAVRQAQDECGAQGVCFALCSDLHVGEEDNAFVRNLGAIAASVMDQTDVPLMINCGDLMTNDSLAMAEWLKPCYDRAWQYLRPVKERLLLLQGNHDGAWGVYSAGNMGNAYKRNLSPDQLWQYLFRPQSGHFERVFGPAGTYFYVDDTPQKTRFICLNSHDGQWSQNEDGTAVWNTMSGGYTQQQLDWLIDALHVEADWCIILASHVPPTARLPIDYSRIRCTDLVRGVVSAYARRGAYEGSYTHDASAGEDTWADASVSVDFSAAGGEIAGWFCGHAHRDEIILGDLPFPIVTVTCAGNLSYDETQPLRMPGTSGETAVDFVTVNRKNRTLIITRLGAGESRQCSYAPLNLEKPNQLPMATDDDGSILNGTGWLDGYRISASSGSVSANAATDLTGYIPVSVGDTVTFTNMLMPEKTANVGVHFYSARDVSSKLLSVAGWDGSSGFPGTTWTYTADEEGNVLSFVVPNWEQLENVAFMRVVAREITGDSVITVEA